MVTATDFKEIFWTDQIRNNFGAIVDSKIRALEEQRANLVKVIESHQQSFDEAKAAEEKARIEWNQFGAENFQDLKVLKGGLQPHPKRAEYNDIRKRMLENEGMANQQQYFIRIKEGDLKRLDIEILKTKALKDVPVDEVTDEILAKLIS